LKILQVIPTFVPAWRYGGPIKALAELCSELARLGQSVTVFTTNVDGPHDLAVPIKKPIQMDGFDVQYFPIQKPRSYSFSWPIVEALSKNVPDYNIIHIHSIFNWPITPTAFYCRKYGIPYIVSPRGMLSPVPLTKGAWKKKAYCMLVERRNLNGAAAIHFTSEEERTEAAPFGLKIPSFVVPNGINQKEFADLPPPGDFRKNYPEVAGKKLLLFLGRISWKKGLDLLVRAYGALARARDDLHLIFVGPDDEGYRKKVENWLAMERVQERVTFTGMLTGEDKLAAFVDADVFCLPSYQENFGMAVIEAMACGLPVVISDRVNIWRDIKAAGAGMVTACNAGEIARAITSVLSNEESAEKMGAQGKNLVREMYSSEIVAEAMLEIYERVLAGFPPDG
jgi:glycosyltransferase involved in cell wall biosynthesis